MIKRIAINPGFTDFIMPKQFIAPVSNSERHFRLTVAKCIDNLSDTHDIIDSDACIKFRDNDEWYMKCKNVFYFKDTDSDYILIQSLKVVEVDASKRWKVSTNKGFEEIVYYSEPVLVDAESNMYEW